MHFAFSLLITVFGTLAGTSSHFKSRDLDLVDNSVNLFPSEEPALLADTSGSIDGYLGGSTDSLLQNIDPTSPPLPDNDGSTSPLLDDAAISNNLDSSCPSPAARKRELFDEDLLLGRSPKYLYLYIFYIIYIIRRGGVSPSSH